MLISLVGMAFAVCMDNISQAALFSLAAQGQFAWTIAGLLGLTFATGMLATETASGWWVTRMLGSGQARDMSRALTLSIALPSLAVAATGIARMFSQKLDHWYDAHTLKIGVAALLLPPGVYLAGGAPTGHKILRGVKDVFSPYCMVSSPSGFSTFLCYFAGYLTPCGASHFLLLRQNKVTKEKASPKDKANNDMNAA